MWRLRTLASQMLLGIVGVLIVTTAVGAVLYGRLARQTLDSQYEERARTAADMVAALAEVRQAVAAGDPQNQLQPLAQHLGERAGLTYIVITDRTGLRFSHPNPQLVGQRLEEPVAALDGRDHVGVDNGSLGRSANGKAPIVDASGEVIGQVSVGILETQVASEASAVVPTILEYSALALLVGTVAAFLIARALKRLTFGLELRQIAALLQEREAMLYGIHEGVIGFDTEGRVRLINDQARRLLGIRENAIGRRLTDLLPAGRLRECPRRGDPGYRSPRHHRRCLARHQPPSCSGGGPGRGQRRHPPGPHRARGSGPAHERHQRPDRRAARSAARVRQQAARARRTARPGGARGGPALPHGPGAGRPRLGRGAPGTDRAAGTRSLTGGQAGGREGARGRPRRHGGLAPRRAEGARPSH